MVYSDEWRAYNQVGSIPGLDHRTVNHLLFFVNPVTGVHMQTIESYWNRIKTKLKTMKGVRRKCCLGISTNSCGGSMLVRTSSRRFVARYPGNIRCNQFCCITYMILGFFLIVSLVNQFGQSSKFVAYPLSCVPNIAFSLEFECPSSDPLTPGASYWHPIYSWDGGSRSKVRRTPPLDISLWELCQNPIILVQENYKIVSNISHVTCTMYQHKVDVDMLNTLKSVLADVSSISPSSEQRASLLWWRALQTSANILFMAFSISTSTLHWYIVRFSATPMQTKTSSHRD